MQKFSTHLQSPLHHHSPFPWGHSAHVFALWFPQLTEFSIIRKHITVTHIYIECKHIDNYVNQSSIRYRNVKLTKFFYTSADNIMMRVPCTFSFAPIFSLSLTLPSVGTSITRCSKMASTIDSWRCYIYEIYILYILLKI